MCALQIFIIIIIITTSKTESLSDKFKAALYTIIVTPDSCGGEEEEEEAEVKQKTNKNKRCSERLLEQKQGVPSCSSNT